MAIKSKALLWAALIIGAAIFARWHGLSDGASFGIVAGLSGAAWGTLYTRTPCGRGCLQ
jgi:membrane protease YdiL (CAAX protease family)